LGLKQAGFAVLGAVDCDRLAVETYRRNHPEVRVWSGDIRNVQPSVMMKKLGLAKGDLDLLAGCPPCQGFSKIRTRNRAEEVPDPRNDLVHQFARFVRALLPKSIMIENVPGLDASDRIEKLQAVLEKLGYVCKRGVRDAASYGVPQRRQRMLLLASRVGKVSFARRNSARRFVRDAIAHLPAPAQSEDALHSSNEKRSARIVRLIEAIPKDGGSRAALPEAEQLACHRRSDGFKDIYGRMAWSKVAPTITGGCVNPSKGRFLHPEQNRAITLREAALLQSFPESYWFSLARGKFAAAVMIGNALPPEFVRRQAAQVARSSRFGRQS